jgi:hypothetical protein
VPQNSRGLAGYHFYATDLCLQAELAGGSAYVIDFHLFHYGRGKTDASYWEQKQRLEAHYRAIWPGRTVTTTTKALEF